MDQGKVLELYYDHYKETNELNGATQSRRNRSFLILCILEAISLLMVWNPQLIVAIFNDAVRSKIESTVQIGSNVLQTLVWLLVAYVQVRYVQEAMHVERQYDYINKLEDRINNLLGENGITREGESYLEKYPPVLNLVHLFYNLFCPIFFSFINIYHIILEWRNGINIFPLIADSFLCLAIIIITIFFFFEIHKKTRAFFLKCKPIALMDKSIRKWLKGV